MALPPPGGQAEREARHRETCLHHGRPLIGTLPLDEQSAVVEGKSCGLLGEIHIKGGTGEQ
jgi:hypothetical protein